MTYNVFSGTLNPTHLLTYLLILTQQRVHTNYSRPNIYCTYRTRHFAGVMHSHHPLPGHRPHHLHSEFSGFLFVLVWHTE